MNHNGKRLRDVDYPRITFHAPDRTFDRLLKETSLHDLKQTVIRKLDLPSDTVISLVQIRDDHTVDLEDEDDFEAFYTVAYSQRVVNVQVIEHLRPSSVSDEEARPRKKHKEKHDLPGPAESGRVKVGAREGKKRRVSFAESSSEGLGLRAVSEEPRRKKRKDDSGSVMAVAVAEPGSSHDSIKKKGKKKPEANASPVSPVPDDDDRSRHNGTMGAQPTAHDVSLEGDQYGNSTPSSTHHKEKKKRTSILSNQSESARAKVAVPVVESSSISDQSLAPSKQASGMNDDSDDEQHLDGHKGVAIQEANHGAHNTGTSSPGGKMEKRIMSSETANGSESATPDSETRNAEEHQILTDVTAEPIVNAQIKDIVSRLLLAKRKEIQAEGTTAIAISKDTTTSKSVTEDGTIGDKKKTPKLTKAISKSDVPACLVCSKAPKHDLMNCSLVQEGPSAIQKRIKALRSRKIPDEDKLPLIQELMKIKNDMREKAKRSSGKAKVNAQSRSHPTASRPPDAGDNDVSSDRTKKVAGASPQQRPVNQLAPGDREASRTSSTPSLDAGVQQRAEDGDKSFISPSVGDLSTLAHLDLDALVRGPESTLLSVTDLPSSEDENDDADRMSGEPEEDKLEKSYPRSKSSRNDSSERESSDDDDGGGGGDDDEVPMNSITHAQNHDTAADTLPDSSSTRNILNNNLKERSIPQASEKDVTSVDVANGGIPRAGSKALGDDQPVSDNLNKSVVIPATARPVRELVTPVENLASSITQTLAENNSARTTRRSSRRIRDTEVEEANKSTNSSPALRHNKHSPAVKETSAEPGTGKRKRVATKTPREVSLSQAFDAVHDSVTKSMTRAPSPPTREHELRTPAKSTGKIARASNGKGKPSSTIKTMQKNATTAVVMDLRTRRSQQARKASPPITNWTTLAPAEDDSSIMNDGLVLSSPLAARSSASKKGAKKGAKKGSKKAVKFDTGPTAPSDDNLSVDLPSRSDSEEEAEVNSSLTTNGQTPHGYRRLSEIPGQPFAKRSNSNPIRSRTSKADKATDLYGRQGKRDDVEDESESDSNSESEIGKKSHIPKARIAGG